VSDKDDTEPDYDESDDSEEFEEELSEPRERNPVLLPATLLFLVLAVIAAGVIAFILTEPSGDGVQTAEKTEIIDEPAKIAPPAPPRQSPATAQKKPADEPMPAEPVSPPPVTQPKTAPLKAEPVPEPKVAAVPRQESAVAPPATSRAPNLPKQKRTRPLRTSPDPGLIANTRKGPLPVVGHDGREAWRVYARPFNKSDKRPRIAIVVYGLGNSAAATRAAIQGLPGEVTLAFSPYARQLPNWITAARAAGHEVLMLVPMEPINYPDFDPGPQALVTSSSDKENLTRLNWILGRGTSYVGVMDFMGSRFTASPPHMRMFLKALSNRGLLFLESRTGALELSSAISKRLNVPFAANTLYIDRQASRTAIDGQLKEAERIAKARGEIVVMGFPYPVTLERINSWAGAMEKRGFALAPVSALAKRGGK